MSPKSVILVGVSPLVSEVALSFARGGADIAIVFWDGQLSGELEAIVSKCKQGGARDTITYTADLSLPKSWSSIISSVVQRFEKLDYLIYFDGLYYEKPLVDGLPSNAKLLMEVNFIAPVMAIQTAYPFVQKSGGNLAVIINECAGEGALYSSLYMGSKLALEGFIKKFSEVSGLGISCIYPGIPEYRHIQNTENQRKNNFIVQPHDVKSQLVESVIQAITSKERECALAVREAKKSLVPVAGKHYPAFSSDPSVPPLHLAILENHKNEIKELLKNIKRNPDIIVETDSHGRTALHYASYTGNADLLGQLITKLRKKTLVNAKDNSNFTPLHVAAKYGHLGLVRRILRENGDPNALTDAGDSPLHFLARFNPASDNVKEVTALQTTLKALIDLGADVNQRNGYWETPLHEASAVGSLVTINFLIKNEGDVHRKTKASCTPLMYAMKPSNHDIIEVLLKAGADPVDCFEIAPNSALDLLEQFREKNRRPEDDDDSREREVVVVNSIDDLPPIAKKLLDASPLLENVEAIEKNWSVFLYVLRFLTRKVYRTPQEQEEYDKKPHSEKTHKREVRSRAMHGYTLDQATEKFITNGNPRKLYKTLEDAGRGGFGSVYIAKRIEDKRRIAIKRVPHLSEREQWNNFDEIYFLDACSHSCIVKYYSSYICRDELWLTMEYLEGGSLQQAVTRYRLEESQICYVTKEILRGIRAIHRKNMIHRDLKSANVMLSVNGDIKIIDFGLCVEVGSVELTNMVGSPFWIPPEMIRREEHGPPADIWSLAILCLEMAHGRPPHRHSALTAMFYVGSGIAPGLEEPDKWSAEFRTFLSRMLAIDPKERASADELLHDPWMQNADTKKGMREILHHIFIEKSLETSLGIVM